MGRPYPNEIVSIPEDANLLKSATGSDPEESTIINGVVTDESSKHLEKSKVGGIINFSPIFSIIQSFIAGILYLLAMLSTVLISKNY